MDKNEKVVMLPGLQSSLEEKAFKHIEEKEFSKALNIIEELSKHQISKMNLNIGKAICLSQLNRLDDALIFLETLLNVLNKDVDYWTYFEYYITLLYQANEYEEMITLISEERRDIPSQYQEKFNDLYKIAFQLNEKIKLVAAKEHLTELEIAINNNDDKIQWDKINTLRKLKVKPPKEVFVLLGLNKIHPVVKTSIFNWLKSTHYNSEIKVVKLNSEVFVNPSEIESLTKHKVVIKTLFYLTKIQQENPTLHQMIEEMLIKYVYVIYPIMYNESDAQEVARALEHICTEGLYGESRIELTELTMKYINDINKCYKLYFEVVES